MFRPREYIDKSTEYQVEAALGLLVRQFRNRWLLSNNGLQFRDQTHHELSVRIERLMKGIAPLAQLLFALTQKWLDKALKGLRQRGIRDIPFVLVELSRCKKATRRNQRFVQLIDDGGFADSGIAGNQHQLRPAALDDAVKGGEQGIDLECSPVQLLGDQQPVGCVVFAKRKWIDSPMQLPFRK